MADHACCQIHVMVFIIHIPPAVQRYDKYVKDHEKSIQINMLKSGWFIAATI